MGPQTNMAIVVAPAVAQQRIERASAKRKTGPHVTKAVTLLSIKKCLEILCCICKKNPFFASAKHETTHKYVLVSSYCSRRPPYKGPKIVSGKMYVAIGWIAGMGCESLPVTERECCE